MSLQQIFYTTGGGVLLLLTLIQISPIKIDPWTASGVAGWLDCSKKENMRVYIQPRGSHTARIGNMPENTKNEIIGIITNWLKTKQI